VTCRKKKFLPDLFNDSWHHQSQQQTTQRLLHGNSQRPPADSHSSVNVAAAAADNFTVGMPVAQEASNPVLCSSSSGAALVDPCVSLRPTRILFTPEPWVPSQHLGRIRVLHRIRPAMPGCPPNLSIKLASTGRRIAIDNGAYDDGAMPVFMATAVADELGIASRAVDSVPPLQMADGEFKSSFVARTEPLTLILGEGTPMPLHAFFPEGIWLTKGDAGGMYQICIGTNAFSAYCLFAHPASQHLVWFPLAPKGDMSVINGVPIDIFQGQHAQHLQRKQQQSVSASTIQAADERLTVAMYKFPDSSSLDAAAACVGVPVDQLPAAASAAASSSASAAGPSVPAAQQVAVGQDAAAAPSSGQTVDSPVAFRWYQPDPAALDQLVPDPVAEQQHDERWEVHPTGQWILGNHPLATEQQKQQLVEILERRRGAFAYSLAELPAYVGPLGPAKFELVQDRAMWCPPRRYNPDELAIGDEKVAEMLAAGIIKEVPTTNRHASAITMPLKRAADGSWTEKRFCIDLRQINANTVPDRYGMPLPEDLFQQMQGARFLTKLDMRSGFFAIALEEESKQHTAFWWRGKLFRL
jgi:hypothetical protein